MNIDNCLFAKHYYWEDETSGGWFCEISGNDGYITDSMKIDFPLDLDDIPQDEESQREYILEKFPHVKFI